MAKEYREANIKRAQGEKSIDVASIDKIMNRLPAIIDIDPTLEKQHSNISPELYSRGRIHVVLESEDHSPDVEMCETNFRYTEKTIKTMFLGYPFLVYGNFGTMKLLNSHGFKTFHPLLNETYDLIPVKRHRVQALLNEIERLDSLSDEAFLVLTYQLVSITKHNQGWLQSKSFKDNLRTQGEYALGLTNVKAQDYSELFEISELAMKQVNAPVCVHVPDMKCNPVCGSKIMYKEKAVTKQKYLKKIEIEKEKKAQMEKQKLGEREDHTLVFESVRGDGRQIMHAFPGSIELSNFTASNTTQTIMDAHKPGAMNIVPVVPVAIADE